MNKKSERYSFEKAQEEAAELKRKVESQKAANYLEADQQIRFEKLKGQLIRTYEGPDGSIIEEVDILEEIPTILKVKAARVRAGDYVDGLPREKSDLLEPMLRDIDPMRNERREQRENIEREVHTFYEKVSRGSYPSFFKVNHVWYGARSPRREINELNPVSALGEQIYVMAGYNHYISNLRPLVIMGEKNPRFRKILEKNIDDWQNERRGWGDDKWLEEKLEEARSDIGSLYMSELEKGLVAKGGFDALYNVQRSDHDNDLLLTYALLKQKPVFIPGMSGIRFPRLANYSNVKLTDIAECIIDVAHGKAIFIR